MNENPATETQVLNHKILKNIKLLGKVRILRKVTC